VPRRRLSLAPLAVATVLLQAGAAQAATLRVDAKANIFAADQTPPRAGSPSAGLRPPSARVSGGVVTFSRVVGTVGCQNRLTNGPDGNCTGFTGTNVGSHGGIAGIVDSNSTMFMVGVFLTNSSPSAPAPERLDFGPSALGNDFTSLSPAIGQTFFIGDGKTSRGTTQRFRIPAGATRLFLGFSDGFGFRGAPGAYDDNVGSLAATFDTSGVGEPPPPIAGKSVVAQVTQGRVFIRVPAGKRIRRGSRRGRRSAVASARRFRRYRGKANIPVGSVIDTRRGRIAITSAADLRGTTQRAVFYAGVFQIRQRRSSRPVTDAALVTSRRGCGSGSARGSQRRRRVLGRLWANGRGRFRTRGRYSAASVRGTTWLTEERCDGTLTRVRKGTVAVRDRVRGRTVLLTAGQSYFARAQRASGG
jgi:hypothetical protein